MTSPISCLQQSRFLERIHRPEPPRTDVLLASNLCYDLSLPKTDSAYFRTFISSSHTTTSGTSLGSVCHMPGLPHAGCLRLTCSALEFTQSFKPCKVLLLAYMRDPVCDSASSRTTTINTNYTHFKHGGQQHQACSLWRPKSLPRQSRSLGLHHCLPVQVLEDPSTATFASFQGSREVLQWRFQRSERRKLPCVDHIAQKLSHLHFSATNI